eukprot:6183493-Pleurochrysis_carterae.AAC.4
MLTLSNFVFQTNASREELMDAARKYKVRRTPSARSSLHASLFSELSQTCTQRFALLTTSF